MKGKRNSQSEMEDYILNRETTIRISKRRIMKRMILIAKSNRRH